MSLFTRGVLWAILTLEKTYVEMERTAPAFLERVDCTGCRHPAIPHSCGPRFMRRQFELEW